MCVCGGGGGSVFDPSLYNGGGGGGGGRGAVLDLGLRNKQLPRRWEKYHGRRNQGPLS